MTGRLPIIYVRGFARGTAGIDAAVDDPFYGFNTGATHIRVGGDGEPAFYQFEGPMVRLMSDEGYQVVVHGNQAAFLLGAPDRSLPAASLWVYRFYDSAADTFGHRGKPYDLLTAATGLLSFLQLVLARTGAPKAWLVAHSMGGLICRSMLQKVCPDRGIAPAAMVDKLFTYATPHNGISFAVEGLSIDIPEIAPFGADIFSREKMYAYLTPRAQLTADGAPPLPDETGKPQWDARVIPDSILSRDRVFCLIGTNASDYGLVSRAVGKKSDGLVQIDNAYVRGAHRAFVHRSHSGAYGEVNSEEGYQNLRRFLFGRWRVAVGLCALRLPGPAPGAGSGISDIWQAEVRVSIRGLPVLISEQVAAHYCPIQLNLEAARAADSPDSPVPLTALFLLDPDRDEGSRDGAAPPRCRWTLQLRVIHLQQRHGAFFWEHHLESAADWEDTLITDIGPAGGEPAGGEPAGGGPAGGQRLWAAWSSQVPAVTAAQDPITAQPLAPAPPLPGEPGDAVACTIGLPAAGRAILGPSSHLRLTVAPWS